MKIFRIHSIRTVSVILLIAGVLFHFMKPAQSKVQTEAFASWLQSNLKSQDDALISQQIKELSSNSKELDDVIRKASELVKVHSGKFELPIHDSDTGDEHEIFRLLISEWDAYKTSHNGMGKAVIIKQLQPHSVLPVDGLAFISKAQMHQKNQILAPALKSYQVIALPAPNYYISPLSGGTAIGAP